MHFLSTVILTLPKEMHVPPSQNDKCVNHCCRQVKVTVARPLFYFYHYFVRCESEKLFLTLEHLCFILNEKHLCAIENTSGLQKSPFSDHRGQTTRSEFNETDD